MRWVSRDIDEIRLDPERLQCGPSSTRTTSTAATEATPPPPTRCCSPPSAPSPPGRSWTWAAARAATPWHTRRARPPRHRHPHHSPGYRQCPGQCPRPGASGRRQRRMAARPRPHRHPRRGGEGARLRRQPGARRMGRGGLRLGRGRRPGHPRPEAPERHRFVVSTGRPPLEMPSAMDWWNLALMSKERRPGSGPSGDERLPVPRASAGSLVD